MGDEALEAELCGAASYLAAFTYRYLLAVAEYDRRGAYERWECASMAHWLSWRTGTSPVTARDQVRVARALQALPGVSGAMSQGRLSYSQVRAINRVATQENDAVLLGGWCKRVVPQPSVGPHLMDHRGREGRRELK